MKTKHLFLILISSVFLLACNSNDDGNEFRDILEIWDLESIEVNELYDFNDDNDFTGNLSNELNCTNFDTYTLYTGGLAIESVSKNLALYFNSNTGEVEGTCNVLSEIQEGILSWFASEGMRTFSLDESSVEGTVTEDLLIFEDIEFPIYSNSSLNEVDSTILATFTYRLRQE